ncbi:MAG: hypothetical protein K940chlam2_00390 [Chlamydiae bacterium]|nr:hypothetical protein [Chlamydiota bacterium]
MIEFVSPPIAVGKEALHTFNKIKTKHGLLQLLSPTDCVKDRLASFFHWDDPQALTQAIEVSLSQKIDFKEIEHWSKKEGKLKDFRKFIQSYDEKTVAAQK